ncbi:MAG TPA: hypothetical protein PK767_01150 [Clostridiales bacterium]|nr:hypothetical protein [Clostridiales bacterium]HOL90653.1 hypothetical protein [Clostridiales bacterium]HPP34834.1 hypothetical protein [Clostridiales bacterium]
MKFKVTLGCAACGYSDTVEADTVFDCSGLVCPKCKNEDCLSITAVSETTADTFKKQNILQRLKMIQNL